MRRFVFLLCLLAGVLLSLPARAQDTFTLAVVPDTQQEVLRADDERFKNRMQWIVDNRDALNIKMMLQCGDMMNWDTPDHFQYERASAGLAVLDKAGIPYALAIGNHDTAATKEGGSAAPGNTNTNQRNTTTFNTYFPLTRQKTIEGNYPPGDVANAYRTFRAGGLDWLVINVELWPRAGAVEWTNSVVQRHPNHNVIIVTHSYLTGGNTIEQRNGGYGDNSPQYLFDHAIKENANVRMVFCGHTGSHGYSTSTGAKGNTIYQFRQCYHDGATNPVRLLKIDTKKGTIESRVFCPSIGKDKEDGSTFTVSDVTWVPAGAAPVGAP